MYVPLVDPWISEGGKYVPVKNVAILGGKSSFTNKKCFIL
jgi:hypothetical protein